MMMMMMLMIMMMMMIIMTMIKIARMTIIMIIMITTASTTPATTARRVRVLPATTTIMSPIMIMAAKIIMKGANVKQGSCKAGQPWKCEKNCGVEAEYGKCARTVPQWMDAVRERLSTRCVPRDVHVDTESQAARYDPSKAHVCTEPLSQCLQRTQSSRASTLHASGSQPP